MKFQPHPARPGPLAWDRRDFLRRSAAALAGGPLALSLPQAGLAEAKPPVIDTNAYLGPCPFRRLPQETSAESPDSVARFARAAARDCASTWVASFEALLQRDFDAVNDRLAALAASDKEAARQFQLFGAVNPLTSGWRETLRRLQQVHRMRGIRLHPNFHGYGLDHPAFAALLDAAHQRKLIVQIALRMEDPRTLHPALSVEDADPRPLLELLPKLPGARVQLLNAASVLGDRLLLGRLALLGVHFDTAMLEGMAGIARVLERVPEIPLCHGSYAPFFYSEAAVLKLAESAPELDPRRLAGVSSHHAENLLTLG